MKYNLYCDVTFICRRRTTNFEKVCVLLCVLLCAVVLFFGVLFFVGLQKTTEREQTKIIIRRVHSPTHYHIIYHKA
jgi:hypothetical protein